jgi:hypothetical protein
MTLFVRRKNCGKVLSQQKEIGSTYHKPQIRNLQKGVGSQIANPAKLPYSLNLKVSSSKKFYSPEILRICDLRNLLQTAHL